LSQRGHSITIIDHQPDAFKRAHARGVLRDDFKGEVVIGDGTDAELLRTVGLDQAEYFIALTEGDNRNIMAAQIAQVIFKVPTVICRIYDPIREEIYRNLGLKTYCPTLAGVSAITKLVSSA
ncbi:MAG: NAD-binding protein, partial [Candidatus Dormibacteraceae bacterium]